MPLVDHLVWGGLDLEAEIDRLERRTGVQAALGGRHPREGTRNALLRVGSRTYLELIAPDPEQPTPGRPRWFGLDALQEPRLITWAVRSSDLDRRRTAAHAAGVPLGEVQSGRRELEGGRALSWRLTYPDPPVGDGLVPFLIDWGDGPHPAESAPPGLELIELHAEHPSPGAIAELLVPLGLRLRIDAAPRPALVATFDSPRGRVELR